MDAECTHDGSIKHLAKFAQWGWDTFERRARRRRLRIRGPLPRRREEPLPLAVRRRFLDPERLASLPLLQGRRTSALANLGESRRISANLGESRASKWRGSAPWLWREWATSRADALDAPKTSSARAVKERVVGADEHPRRPGWAARLDRTNGRAVQRKKRTSTRAEALDAPAAAPPSEQSSKENRSSAGLRNQSTQAPPGGG